MVATISISSLHCVVLTIISPTTLLVAVAVRSIIGHVSLDVSIGGFQGVLSEW